MGPQMCNALRKIYGEEQVICQGVGPKYTASITDNIGGIGTSRAAVAEATGMFQKAASKCPDAQIAFGGYRFVLPELARLNENNEFHPRHNDIH